MDTNTLLIGVGAIFLGLIIGFIIAKTLEKSNASKLIKSAKKESATVLKEAKHEAEALKKDKKSLKFLLSFRRIRG
jgi:ribonuclease Y